MRTHRGMVIVTLRYGFRQKDERGRERVGRRLRCLNRMPLYLGTALANCHKFVEHQEIVEMAENGVRGIL